MQRRRCYVSWQTGDRRHANPRKNRQREASRTQLVRTLRSTGVEIRRSSIASNPTSVWPVFSGSHAFSNRNNTFGAVRLQPNITNKTTGSVRTCEKGKTRLVLIELANIADSEQRRRKIIAAFFALSALSRYLLCRIWIKQV